MSRLIILGNGFDLHYKLPTTYNEHLVKILKKNNKEFRESFLDQYFSYINLQEIENIHLLTKKNGLRKEFSFTNVKPYYKNSTWKDIDNTEMFFSEVWGLEVKE